MRLLHVSLIIYITVVSFAYGQEKDTLSFIKSKRMSDADLAKKKEGAFVTGLPDFSSDPVAGLGFGAQANVFWNGERDNPLFPYTPYLVRLRANAAYYSSNARELALSLDVPYYKGSRWRFRIDAKAQQNPTNLYFGLTEKTLTDLHLPSDENTTYSSYREFDKERQVLRPGTAGEADMVSDGLSNRFMETEFMLNLKADYALGNGRWRIMGGYEIQHLQFRTFEGITTEAFDPATNRQISAPNGLSLLRRDYEQGIIHGLEGGLVSLIQTVLIYDTRDFEPDPTHGIYFEVANEYADKYTGSQFTFDKLFIQGRAYQQLPIGPRTVLAGRIGIGTIFGNQAPFFEYLDQWSPEGSISALGGRESLRGYRSNRFLAKSMWFANIELRAQIAELIAGSQRFAFALAPFFDAGTVRDRWQDLGFRNTRTAAGGGLRIAWNQSTIISLDYGLSREDRLFFISIGQTF